MTADAVLSRELESLKEELSASHRERLSPADRTSTSGATAARAGRPEDIAEEQQLRAELREFVNVITEFVEEAEKKVSENPTASVVGAMVVGILIGRLLGRR
ncbi:MAG TPA: hypothetical protein VEK12_10140 [Alphaproteobacteria bacterium]|nr:hypothetical protein [Alphaproteobacteria bacterium]